MLLAILAIYFAETLEISSDKLADLKKDILEYTKKISDIQDFSYRGITKDTPMDDAFANIFSMLPQYKRDQIIRRMDRIYW